MWNVADDNEIKLAIKKIMKMKNRTNWIAYIGNSIKIFMKGDDMELERQAKPKKSLIDIMNRRFDSMDKRMDEKFVLMNKKFDEKFVLIFQELKDLKKETNKIDSINKRLDSIEKELKNDIKNIDTKLNNVIELNNLKV